MIRVLKDWNEVGEAILALQKHALPIHEGPQKNWDHRLLWDVASPLPRSARVLDMGCGGGFTLKFLHALKFEDLTGIDLNIEWRLRLQGLKRRIRGRTFRAPWRVARADITRTPLPPAQWDLLTCVSVIEHGVDVPRFFRECARLLRPGGRLFLTTDYWETPVPEARAIDAFGFPWRIFSRDEIGQLLEQAREAGLRPEQDGDVPACHARTVFWQGCEYTALAAVLLKDEPRPA